MVPDTFRTGRVIGGIQRMTSDSRYGDDVRIPLESGVHGPEHIIDVKAVHVLIHDKYMLQLAKGGEGKESCLPLSPFITWR